MNNETLHANRIEKVIISQKQLKRTDKTLLMEPGVFKIDREHKTKYLIFFVDNSVIATTSMVQAVDYCITYVRGMADSLIFSPDSSEYAKLHRVQSGLLKARNNLMKALGKRHIAVV